MLSGWYNGGMKRKRRKNPYAVALGRRGGKARLRKMTREERVRVARQAARTRWGRAGNARKKAGTAEQPFTLAAHVSSDDPAAIRPVLVQLVGEAGITPTADGFQVRAEMTGASARDLNRTLLTSLRRVVKKTRLRAEWTAEGRTERFFDYVPKGTRFT